MGRAPCCDKNGLKKGPWTPEEDQKLIDYIQDHGHGSWRTLPKNAGLQRCGKSCRLRWTNYLRPDIKRGRFSFEEEEIIIQLHSVLGNKWSAIAARLPGRTDNEIKNYWNTHIRKRLLRMGIDPVTHSPRLDLLDLSSVFNSSLYTHQSQLNLSRLLGLQQFVNPDVLRIASTLLSQQQQSVAHQNETTDLLLQNLQVQNQFPQQFVQPNSSNIHQEIQNNCTTTTTTTTTPTPCTSALSFDPFLNDQLVMQVNLNQFQSNHHNFAYQNSNDQPNIWQDNNNVAALQTDIAGSLSGLPNLGFYSSDQSSVIDPSSENSNFNNAAFNFGALTTTSVLSTPSSSPTELTQSCSTHLNSSTTEDERDSYCSELLKFEIPSILDVSDFM
ncbi:hypothetical protein Sjap_025463 [Stephania japonica]|uniref:Uncharacterized protein n=1 Tax=Stephania japonica TaxID=461633 RepID=A0AAP0E660_9MAGN